MRKFLVAALMLAVFASPAAPAFAADYSFGSGPTDASAFGKPTSTDEPVSKDPMNLNIRRNKDSALLPPPYFYGSGDIPTDPSSLYHDNTPSGAGSVTGGGSVGAGAEVAFAPGNGSAGVFLPPTSVTAGAAANTEPKYYADGSIGTLYIQKLNKTVRVFEGESPENMKKGIGHFESTSAWDGNCVFAGHNRGASAYFSFVKDLAIGDKITYTTLYGTRDYEVCLSEKISETDYSALAWSSQNIISLITCAADEPAYRILVTAKQI
jgi:sortase A